MLYKYSSLWMLQYLVSDPPRKQDVEGKFYAKRGRFGD